MTDNTVTILLKDPNGGDDDREVVLKPTFGAATKIPKVFGGYMPAIEAVSKLDPVAMETIIVHGLGLLLPGQKEMNVPGRIWATGVAVVATPCVEYLTILMNGGKRPAETTEDAKGTEGEA